MPTKKTPPAKTPDKTTNKTPNKTPNKTTDKVEVVPRGHLTPAAAYAHFLPEAQNLPQASVQTLRLDPVLTFGNVQSAVAAVAPHAARVKTELPAISVDALLGLPDLSAAVLYATEQCATKPIKKQELDEKLSALHKLRTPMLLVAEALSLLGLVKKEKVASIRAGMGPFDAAQDGLALCELYTDAAKALVGKHPFSAEQIADIGKRGQELMRLVTPQGAHAEKDPAQALALEARDRLATLLAMRYADLRRVAVYLWGDAADEQVPPLRSRVRTGKPQNPAPSAAAQEGPAAASAAAPAAAKTPSGGA